MTDSSDPGDEVSQSQAEYTATGRFLHLPLRYTNKLAGTNYRAGTPAAQIRNPKVALLSTMVVGNPTGLTNGIFPR